MNFCVYQDIGTEIHGYLVPDGFATSPVVKVCLNGDTTGTEISTWVFIEGAQRQGHHQTGNVGFILNDENVPGISSTPQVEISDLESGLVFYRRAQPGQFISKKVLRVETSIVPRVEIDLPLKNQFQFFANNADHYGFETIRQMLEIIHQPSVYVSGRLLINNYRVYIDYNIDITMIAMEDPFYEMAKRLLVLSRLRRQDFTFISQRDKVIFRPVCDWLEGVDLEDEVQVINAIRRAPKHAMSLLASPFTQQLVASNPTEVATLNDISKALDILSQFDVFSASYDDSGYLEHIAESLDISHEDLSIKPKSNAVSRLAGILRRDSRVAHTLEVDLVLHHFIEKAEMRALRA